MKAQIKTTVLIVGIVITGLVIYILFFQAPTKSLYCHRKIQTQIANFKKAAFRLGVIHIDEEETYIKSIYPTLYQQCLTD